jgi:hypothetical protein
VAGCAARAPIVADNAPAVDVAGRWTTGPGTVYAFAVDSSVGAYTFFARTEPGCRRLRARAEAYERKAIPDSSVSLTLRSTCYSATLEFGGSRWMTEHPESAWGAESASRESCEAVRQQAFGSLFVE